LTCGELIKLINGKWLNVKNAVENILRGRKLSDNFYVRRKTCGYICYWDFDKYYYTHRLLRYQWGSAYPNVDYELPLREDVEYDTIFLLDAIEVFDEVEFGILYPRG
jgi:hypothetical protein